MLMPNTDEPGRPDAVQSERLTWSTAPTRMGMHLAMATWWETRRRTRRAHGGATTWRWFGRRE